MLRFGAGNLNVGAKFNLSDLLTSIEYGFNVLMFLKLNFLIIIVVHKH